MIDHLDNLLRHLLLAGVTGLTSEQQVRFQPPDGDWRQYVSTLGDTALNVYLVDLRENRKLRSNAHTREIENGYAVDTPAPRRVDCHYLVTAWSPATVTPAVEPTVDEHLLLYQVAAVLVNTEPLVPRRVYDPDPLPPGFPALIADADLPTQVVPPEGFPKYAEFWGTMGAVHPWRPAVYLTVTLPLAPTREVAGPMVTTRITEYRRAGSAAPGEPYIQIGGTIHDGAAQPVAGAWVRLETTIGEPVQTTRSDPQGRFTFVRLLAGDYQLRARVTGHPEVVNPVTIPSPNGSYDLTV